MNNLSGTQTFQATKKKMVLKNFQTSNLSGIQFLYSRFPSYSTVGFGLKPGSKARELLAREVAEVDGMDFFF